MRSDKFTLKPIIYVKINLAKILIVSQCSELLSYLFKNYTIFSSLGCPASASHLLLSRTSIVVPDTKRKWTCLVFNILLQTGSKVKTASYGYSPSEILWQIHPHSLIFNLVRSKRFEFDSIH